MNACIRTISPTNSQFFIKYFPSIQKSTGSEKSAIIAGRLEFWFSKYKTGFYKFLEPCEHPLYRNGDSWSEELGFSRKLFNHAFDLIGIRYKSKTEFLNAPDKFQGKLYASYHDRKTNRTHFVRNHDFAAQFFKGQSRSWNGQIGHSYSNSLKQKKTSSLKNATPQSPKEHSSDFKEVTEGMILIWKKEVGELGVQNVTEALLERLYKALSTFFGFCLKAWETFCRKIASSKFLMGEAQNRFFKKAWITWAIKEDSIGLIQAGHFNCGDREFPKNEEMIKLEIERQEERDHQEKLKIFQDRLADEIRQKRKKTVREKISKLSNQDLEKAKQDYVSHLEIQNTPTAQAFKEMGWSIPFAETLFEMFLMEKVEKEIFSASLGDELAKELKAMAS